MSREVETTICFPLFSFPPLREAVLSRLCERLFFWPLREAVLVWPLREAMLFPCILLSVCMRDSFLFVCPLVDARILHVVISHLLRALDHVFAT